MVTYTFSRALYLMKHSGLKMTSVIWGDKLYCMIIEKHQLSEGKLVIINAETGRLLDDQNFRTREIMGSWYEWEGIKND